MTEIDPKDATIEIDGEKIPASELTFDQKFIYGDPTKPKPEGLIEGKNLIMTKAQENEFRKKGLHPEQAGVGVINSEDIPKLFIKMPRWERKRRAYQMKLNRRRK